LKTIFEACDPEIDWTSLADPALIPWGGDHKGIHGKRMVFQKIIEHMHFEVFEPREFFDGSDIVTVLGRTVARMIPSGVRFESEWVHLIKIRDGKVVTFREYDDTHALVQAFYGGDVHSLTVAPSEMTERLHH
jgi:ketosteroid isomerase-like protein